MVVKFPSNPGMTILISLFEKNVIYKIPNKESNFLPYWVRQGSVIHSNLPWLHNGCTHGVWQIHLRRGIRPTAAMFGEPDRTGAVSKNGIVAIGTQWGIDQPLRGIGVVDVQRIPIGVVIRISCD